MDAVALHDCDILTYDRALLARLLYPVVHPRFQYDFCKGYYARVAAGKLGGRVCRQLVTPLLRALREMHGERPFLTYLDSFRYPLAGEFSRTEGWRTCGSEHRARRLARFQRCNGITKSAYLPGGRSGQLRSQAPGALRGRCQQGLSSMSVDIEGRCASWLPRGLFLAESIRTLKAPTTALRSSRSHHDAIMNGLTLDRDEERAGAVFR